MAEISRYFNITGPVDFIDIDSISDTRMFLQAPVIRYLASKGDKLAQQAAAEIASISNHIFHMVQSPHSKKSECLLLFERFDEVTYVRLGYSGSGFRGRGSGREIGEALYSALAEKPLFLIQYGFLSSVEEAAIYVKYIGADRVSDMVASMAMGTLLDFTEQQMDKHPQLRVGSERTSFWVWDSEHRGWIERDVMVPIVEGAPIVLVPKTWTHGDLEFRKDRMVRQSICKEEQRKRTTLLPNGSLDKPKLDEIQLAIPGDPVELVQFIHRYYEEHGFNAMQVFRDYLHDYFHRKMAA